MEDYTCTQWYEMLENLSRPSIDGYMVTLVRNNDGFSIVEFSDWLSENLIKESETICIQQNIADAYSWIRAYLIKHKETGFYTV